MGTSSSRASLGFSDLVRGEDTVRAVVPRAAENAACWVLLALAILSGLVECEKSGVAVGGYGEPRSSTSQSVDKSINGAPLQGSPSRTSVVVSIEVAGQGDVCAIRSSPVMAS